MERSCLTTRKRLVAPRRRREGACNRAAEASMLTPEYAEKIGADWYAKDAKRSADIAKEFFGV